MGHTRQSSSPAIGIPEMLARGLIERGESLGINKTLYSAVAELKVWIASYSFISVADCFDRGIFPISQERC